MSKISVVIITKNEAGHIRNCLGSVQWADEIIVVDSGSTDETVEIAKSMGAQVFYHKWEGYVQQREFAIQQASSEWILVIDADEVVTSDVIWTCVGCYKCKERCPQEMSPVEVMFILKNWYVASGKSIPGDYQNLLQGILSKGYIQEPLDVLDRNNKNWNRKKLGLPEISYPKNINGFMSALSELASEKL